MELADDNPNASSSYQARNFVFTINFKFTEQGWINGFPRLLDFSLFPSWITYVIYSLELGEESGTHHFQGYLECSGKKSYVQLHSVPGLERARFDRRRGSQEEAIRYCRKVEDPTHLEGPWEWGEKKAPGHRSDLLAVKQKIDSLAPLRVIRDEHYSSWIRYGRAFREDKRQRTLPRDFKSIVFLFIGPAGKGKSTVMKIIARLLGSSYRVPQPKRSGLYYDDYDGQDVLIHDEFDGSTMSPTFFNTLCDEHECVLPIHGGAGHQMISKYIFIGSNYMPKQWWRKRNASQLLQTTRRIDVIFKMGFKDIPSAPPRPPVLVLNILRTFPPERRAQILQAMQRAECSRMPLPRPGRSLPPKDKEDEDYVNSIIRRP